MRRKTSGGHCTIVCLHWAWQLDISLDAIAFLNEMKWNISYLTINFYVW